MKLRVTMKDPDTLHDAVREAVRTELGEMQLAQDERDVLADMRCQRVREECGRWFGYGEYLTVEIDTDAKTCVVVPEHG